MVAICKSIYEVYRTNSTHKFHTQILTLRIIKILLCAENGWRARVHNWRVSLEDFQKSE